MTTKRMTLCFIFLAVFFACLAGLAEHLHSDLFLAIDLIGSTICTFLSGVGIMIWIEQGGDF